MTKEQFETILDKVDFFKTDDNKIDYEVIITILENHFSNTPGTVFSELTNAEYEVLKGGD